MFYACVAKFGFKELSCFCGESECPIDIIERTHNWDYILRSQGHILEGLSVRFPYRLEEACGRLAHPFGF
jgi:hypothetical protein